MKNFKRATTGIPILISLMFLYGCDDNRENLEDYRCSSEQIDLVKKELEVCKGTGFLESYCFLQAKISHCEKININSEGK